MPAATARKPKSEVTKNRPLFAVAPWSTKHEATRSTIEAYVEITGDWETVAEVNDDAGIDAEATANFIARVVNEHEKQKELISQMVAALELCLECKGMTWEAEHDASIALQRAKQA